MKCILLWTLINIGYLYKCPNVLEQPACCNCTTVHTATYDQEFMVMCTESIEKSATTTLPPTETSTTPSMVSQSPVTTSTLPSTTQTPVYTTTEIQTTTVQSTTPYLTSTPEYRTTTKLDQTLKTTTTQGPSTHPTTTVLSSFNNDNYKYIPTNRSDPDVYQTIIHQTSDNVPILITSLSISALALIGCISLTIWTYRKHKEVRVQKMVRPSQVNLELSPSSTQTLTQNDDVESQLALNKIKMEKIKKNVQTNPKAKTARPMMTRRPSEVKKMTLDDWKKLQNELKSKPPVNRKIKPQKKQFKHLPLPTVPSNNKPILPSVVQKNSTVKSMIKKFNKK